MKRYLPFLALIIVGCASRSPTGAGAGGIPSPGPGPDLSTIGDTLMWAGAIVTVLAFAARLAVSYAVSASPVIALFVPFTRIFNALIPAGIYAIFVGYWIDWLAFHQWAIWCATGLTTVAYAIHYWPDLRVWLGFGQTNSTVTNLTAIK